MAEPVEVFCPDCAESDEVTWIVCSSKSRPNLLACRCWGCDHLWSFDEEGVGATSIVGDTPQQTLAVG